MLRFDRLLPVRLFLGALGSMLLASVALGAPAPASSTKGRSGDDPSAASTAATPVRAPATLRPTSTGSLHFPAPPRGGVPAYAPIELTAGYVVTPGGPAPELPRDLVRAHATLDGSSSGRSAFLVEFPEGVPAGEARRRIEAAGGSLVASLSGRAFLVRLDEAEAARLEAAEGVPWVGTWEPAFKVSPRIERTATAPQEFQALLFSDSDASAAVAALRALGATDVEVSKRGPHRVAHFRLAGTGVAAVAALSDLAWIEPLEQFEFLNDRAQWVMQTNTPEDRRLWNLGLRGQGQVVMTSDSGIRPDHEMFADPNGDITGFGDYPNHRKIIAYLRGSEPAEFGDEFANDFHGTHTAGTVAGNPDTTAGGRYDGMAPEARLHFTDLGGNSLAGAFRTPPDVYGMFQPSYTGNAGGAARISSNSWGAYVAGAYTISAMQVDLFMWDHPDYLIAFANGNDGANGSVRSPATAKNCLSVGGTGNGEDRNELYRPTSRGPTKDLRRKPTICAPGDQVVSSIANTRWNYASYSGTSMATPAAAGALALARQYLVEGWYPTGTPVAENALEPSAALLKAMAMNSGTNDVPGQFAPDNHVGWGRIALDDVLYFPGDARRLLLVDAKDGLVDRQYVEYEVHVTDPSQPLEVSLVWTDAPGNPAAARQIVNDLDLVVTHGTTTYRGNWMFNASSIAGGYRDSINVEEGVRVPVPGEGLWVVRVEGPRVTMGPQPYALAITGGVGLGTGTIAIDRAEYALADTIAIEVVDADASAAPVVTASSPSDPYGVTLELTGGHGVFRGRLPLAPSPPNPGDPVLAVSTGDEITIRYADDTPATTVVARARVNGQAPAISDVVATVLGPNSVLVTWGTDQAASSRVHFGTGEVLDRVADSAAGLVREHRVVVTGLATGTTYRFDVESTNRRGGTTRDDLGGQHRKWTTRAKGQLALLLGGPSTRLLDTWRNALDALGWTYDVLTGTDADHPIAGDAHVGLRSYAAVLWQVDPDDYPAVNDVQRAAIDSLLDGGGRLLITGHDLGYSLSDATAPGYSTEREQWLERTLKTRYYRDIFDPVFTMYGVADDPVTHDFTAGVGYDEIRLYATVDHVGPAPDPDGNAVPIWMDDQEPQGTVGLRWESGAEKGSAGTATWGGRRSRLIALFHEWAGLSSNLAANSPERTAVLERSVEWLLEHTPPAVSITSPAPAEIVTASTLPITWTAAADEGRAIVSRSIHASFDGGASWSLVDTRNGSTGEFQWDLTGAGGGGSAPNSRHVLLRVVTTDDGAPALSGETILAGEFTLARPGGDTRGPVLVAGSARTTPEPVRAGVPATLLARFSDALLGDSPVEAAEFSIGSIAAVAGTGTPMTIEEVATTAEASAPLGTDVPIDPRELWVRARDTAGNWGPATALASDPDTSEVIEEEPTTDFLAGAHPNPFGGQATIHFGLAQAGPTQMSVYDIRGRRVRTLVDGTLEGGPHAVAFDTRGAGGERLRAGVYFLRLTTPRGTFHAKVVALE